MSIEQIRVKSCVNSTLYRNRTIDVFSIFITIMGL